MVQTVQDGERCDATHLQGDRPIQTTRTRICMGTGQLDMVVMSDRSAEGHKYLIVLNDRSSDTYQLLTLAHKCDAWAAVPEWMRKLRNNPLYNEQFYPTVSHILTDTDGGTPMQNGRSKYARSSTYRCNTYRQIGRNKMGKLKERAA